MYIKIAYIYGFYNPIGYVLENEFNIDDIDSIHLYNPSTKNPISRRVIIIRMFA